MSGHKTTEANKAAFNAEILRTFGKLSQQDIDKIDGQTIRLATELVEQYGWPEETAQRRALAMDIALSKDAME